MKLSFRRTGGFAPMPIGCQLDTEKMSVREAEQLTRLVDDSEIMETTGKTLSGAKDMHYYDIEIERDGKTHKAHFDHASLPERIRALVQYLLHESAPIP
jgi:hypothetical protein